ncbi:MAG: nucleoside-triphosphatase [Myxococcales bacterium]|jgi:nucleoside-triphosphatase THEP1|nr:nucleoside-triphosphatase [Myxococcales bacterium]
MSTNKTVLLITGKAGSGKSQLLARLAQALRGRHSLGGFVTRGMDRRPALLGAAHRYDLVPIEAKDGPSYCWAVREDGETCVFNDETRRVAENLIQERLNRSENKPEILIIDEIGRLELKGEGFSNLLLEALRSDCPIVIVAIKKKARAEIIEHFHLESAIVLDLDEMGSRQALSELKSTIEAMDAERIGAFAGINGLVEVGLGSMLRALKVPLKGHFLAYLQNILLITFGKALHGRGLFRITFICAMLKAFSPIGDRIRPMLYIFLQGSIFTLPIFLFGFRFLSVLFGSILMAWLTLTMKLLLNYLVFGMAFFDAYANALDKLNEWAQIQGFSLWSVIAAAFILKSFLAVIVAASAYFGNMQPLVQRLKRRPKWTLAPRQDLNVALSEAAPKPSLGKSAFGALRDILNWKYALFFFISALLILFFANLSTADVAAVLLRAICISYVGFLALRRIDFHQFGIWLDKKAGLGLGKSLPVALDALMNQPPDASEQPRTQDEANRDHE